MKPGHVIAGLVALMIVLTGITVHAAEKTALQKIISLTHNGSVVLSGDAGERLVSVNPEKVLVPASVIKILTAMIALDVLGSDFRFSTGFYTNDRGDMVIKGFGDPFLVSDEIRAIAQRLRGSGVSLVNRILLDHTYFSDDLEIPGINHTRSPHDALNGSLVVNFNTIHVRKEPSGKIVSAEPETPLTPLAVAKASVIPPGKTVRISLSSHRADCKRYAGELFAAIFREQGIVIAQDAIGETVVDAAWQLRYVHHSARSLSDVLRGLLKYSNNFIANQIFLAVPQASDNATPASMHKSRRFFENHIRTRLGITAPELIMVEGSGISRENRMTGSIMISILDRFKPHADLLNNKDGHPVKSGTLHGVYNYAGYLRTARGLQPLVIMLNQPKNHRDALLALLSAS